jgi:hypothetical protein
MTHIGPDIEPTLYKDIQIDLMKYINEEKPKSALAATDKIKELIEVLCYTTPAWFDRKPIE